jgi:hypothetical protein
MRANGGIYSRYPAGMVQFALPAVAIARVLGANLDNPAFHVRMEKWTAAWLAALSVGLFFLVALNLGDATTAGIATIFFGTGSVMLSTVGQGLWQHGGLVFWSLLFLLIEVMPASPGSTVARIIQGIACGMMIACRLTAAVIVVPLFVWLIVRDWRRALVVIGSALAAFAPWAALYQSIYGNPFGPSVGLWGGMGRPDIEALGGLLLSPARGLLVYQPWVILLALWALTACRAFVLARAKRASGWPLVCAAIIGLQVIMVASWKCWWGGDCWGSRLLAEAIPFCALLCIPPIACLCSIRGGRMILATLAAASFLIHAVGIYCPPHWEYQADVRHHPERLWSWSYPPFLANWQEPPWPRDGFHKHGPLAHGRT